MIHKLQERTNGQTEYDEIEGKLDSGELVEVCVELSRIGESAQVSEEFNTNLKNAMGAARNRHG